jgi:hypothetical protein
MSLTQPNLTCLIAFTSIFQVNRKEDTQFFVLDVSTQLHGFMYIAIKDFWTRNVASTVIQNLGPRAHDSTLSFFFCDFLFLVILGLGIVD